MGHGWTEADVAQDLTFDGQAQMLLEFLDALNIDKADIVSNDSGTGVAQVFPRSIRSA